MDRIALLDSGPLLRAVDGHMQRIQHLFVGQVRRPICGSWRSGPFSTVRGTNHQVVLRLDDSPKVAGSHEPAPYAVVLRDDQSVTVYAHDFNDRGARFWL